MANLILVFITEWSEYLLERDSLKNIQPVVSAEFSLV